MRPWAKCSYLSMLIVRPSRRRSFEGSMIITLVSLHNRWSLTFACLDICILRVFVVNIIINCTNLPQCTKITQKVSHQLFLFSTVNSFQSEICFPLRQIRGVKLIIHGKIFTLETTLSLGKETNFFIHSFHLCQKNSTVPACDGLANRRPSVANNITKSNLIFPTFDPLMTSDFKNGGDFINS